MSGKKFLIDLEPIGRRIEVPAGVSLLEAAQQAGVDLVAACGGMGICGICRVRPVRGLGFRKGDRFSQTTWRGFP